MSERVIEKYRLRDKAGAQHQTYALGMKEVWSVDPAQHSPGTVWHTGVHALVRPAWPQHSFALLEGTAALWHFAKRPTRFPRVPRLRSLTLFATGAGDELPATRDLMAVLAAALGKVGASFTKNFCVFVTLLCVSMCVCVCKRGRVCVCARAAGRPSPPPITTL